MEQHSPEVDGIDCPALSPEEITTSAWVENGRTNSDYFALSVLQGNPSKKKFKSSASFANGSMDEKSISSFIGDPIPDDEARERWGWRYELKVVGLILLVCFSCYYNYIMHIRKKRRKYEPFSFPITNLLSIFKILSISSFYLIFLLKIAGQTM